MSNTEALKLALTLIEQDRRALLESNAYPPGKLTIPANDPAVDEGLAQYDEAIHAIRSALAQPKPSAPTIEREKFDTLLAQEHALSAAYVRLREIIGAMDPPTTSDPQALWAYVERVAREKMAQASVPSAEPAEPAAASSITPREVAHQVFEVCEDFEATPESPGDSQEVERFKAGVRFASKRIRNAIGDWLTEEERATAQPAPAAVPADLHAYMLQVLKRERAALDGFIALGNEAPRAAKFDRWIAALLAAAPQQAPTPHAGEKL